MDKVLFDSHSMPTQRVLLAGVINLARSQSTLDQAGDGLHHHVSATIYEAG